MSSLPEMKNGQFFFILKRIYTENGRVNDFICKKI